METAIHEPGTDYSKFTVSKEPPVNDGGQNQSDQIQDTTKDQGGVNQSQDTAKDATQTKDAAQTQDTTQNGGANQDTTQPAKIEDADLLKILNERGIQISSFDDYKNVLSERDTLKSEVEKLAKKELEFPNEKAKAIYEFALKHQGNEVAAARNYLNLVELDLTKTDAKTLQFEAFATKHPQLPREEAKAIFEEQYQLDYGDGDFEGKALLKFRHDNATNEAKLAIEQAVKSYKEAKTEEPKNAGPSQEDIQRVTQGVETALREFKGADISLGEYKTKTGQTVPATKLNVAIKPEEAAKLKQYMADPQLFFDDLLETVKGPNGLDWNSYANKVYQLMHPEKVYSDIHSQGVEQGLLLMINTLKNNKREGAQENQGDTTVPKTWNDSLKESRAKQN
jgi:hypothetical protein